MLHLMSPSQCHPHLSEVQGDPAAAEVPDVSVQSARTDIHVRCSLHELRFRARQVTATQGNFPLMLLGFLYFITLFPTNNLHLFQLLLQAAR